MMRIRVFGWTALVACVAFGQTSPARPEFEVVNVSLSKSGVAERTEHFDEAGQFSVHNSTVAELLPLAFQRRANRFAGIPVWMNSERYDIVAKAPPRTGEPALALMMQSLLASEFKLAAHEEERPLDAFALVVAKGGAKFEKAPGPGMAGCKRGGNREQLMIDCPGITMVNLAGFLSFVAQDYIDRAIVDLTGMPGTYQLKLAWTPRQAVDNNGGLTVFDAMTKQLGLKLEQRKLPVAVMVIDRAERPAEK